MWVGTKGNKEKKSRVWCLQYKQAVSRLKFLPLEGKKKPPAYPSATMVVPGQS